MCFFLVLGEVGTFGQVHLVDKTRHLSLIISVCVSQATSDFIDQCQYKDIYIYTCIYAWWFCAYVCRFACSTWLFVDRQTICLVHQPPWIYILNPVVVIG